MMGGTNMIPRPYAMLYWGRQGQLKSRLVYNFTLARAKSPQIPFITDSELDWKYWKIIRKRSMVFFWPGVLLLEIPGLPRGTCLPLFLLLLPQGRGCSSAPSQQEDEDGRELLW